jgi:hypothetical protein
MESDLTARTNIDNVIYFLNFSFLRPMNQLQCLTARSLRVPVVKGACWKAS